MSLSVRIAARFVFTIFWGDLAAQSLDPIVNQLRISSEDDDPGVKYVVPGVAAGQRHIAPG